MQGTLENILARKKRELEQEAAENEVERSAWIKKAEALYKEISGWLKPLENAGYLNIAYEKEIKEDIVVYYDIDKMRIIFFNREVIELNPVGFNVAGANGRVDMLLGLRKVMIVRDAEDTKWMFAERTDRRQEPEHRTFDKANFEQILSEFVEGF